MKQLIPIHEVHEVAEHVISELPDFWRQFRRRQLPRVCEEVSWIYVKGGTVVDLGGGSAFHTSICSRLGMRAINVDNFASVGKGTFCAHFLEPHAAAEEAAIRLGVRIVHADLIDWDPPFDRDSIDVVMSFDNIEHLTHSPRNVYRKMVQCLKPEGLFLLGAPNAANLLKRFRVVLGRNIFSGMDEWYMHDRFIGHVREPIVADLKSIAKDLNLGILNVVGRNWLGLNKLLTGAPALGRGLDRVLRVFPSLCSDIYLLGQKSPQ
jgi:SAM-dependent methyltransferase